MRKETQLHLTPFCIQYMALAKQFRTFPSFVATVYETNELMVFVKCTVVIFEVSFISALKCMVGIYILMSTLPSPARIYHIVQRAYFFL
jgi:hypothetical protein